MAGVHSLFKLVLTVTFLATSCVGATGVGTEVVKTPGNLSQSSGLGLYLVADSQLQTTKHSGHARVWRSPAADRIKDVSMRSEPLEAAAPYLLQRLLDRAKEPVVLDALDALVYLGDGANNGCKDELEMLLGPSGKLTAFRKVTKLPIFYIIGNHDYLGGGNTVGPGSRSALCGGGEAESKLDLIKRISDFNQASAALKSEVTLVDSYKGREADVKKACGTDEQLHDTRKGCFYAGVVEFSSGENADRIYDQLVLLDSSDYADAIIKPETQATWVKNAGSMKVPLLFEPKLPPEIRKEMAAEMKLYPRDLATLAGVRGAMSYIGSDSQSKWLGKRLDEGKQSRVRVLASHYKPAHLKNKLKNLPDWMSGDRVGDIASLTESKRPSHDWLWVSAHSHAQKTNAIDFSAFKGYCLWLNARKKCKRFVQELNVGSTTDWEPHATIVKLVEKKETKTPFTASLKAQYLQLGIKDTADTKCDLVYAEIKRMRQDKGLKSPKTGGPFGLDPDQPKAYRNYNCNFDNASCADRKQVRDNLETLVGNMKKGEVVSETEAWACIGLKASSLDFNAE